MGQQSKKIEYQTIIDKVTAPAEMPYFDDN